jgi:predicted permease
MWLDLRYGLRRLADQKVFSASIILLLAIGIGSNTVIFSFVNSLLLSPLPVRNPGNLYLLQQERKRQVRPDTNFHYLQFQAVQQRKDFFSGAVAEQGWTGNSVQALSLSDGVHPVSTQMVSPNYFSELGVKAMKGRVLNEDDANAGSDIPVVLSEQCWQTQFRRDPHILNRVIRIRNMPFTVVGVLPAAFHGIDADRVPDIRLPISAAPFLTGFTVTEPGPDYQLGFQILVRLANGTSVAAAAGAITPMLTRMEEPLARAWYARSTKPIPASVFAAELSYWSSYRVSLLPCAQGVSRLREQFSKAVVFLMAAVGLLLVVVCSNVAGLLLSKADFRAREFELRLSLGASRWRLTRQLYAENLLLAIPGAVLGVAFAISVSPLLLRFLPNLGVGAYSPPVVLNVQPDFRVLSFEAAATLFTMALFGFAPIRSAWRHDLNRRLGSYARNTSSIVASGLVSFQIGLTVMLLIASLLMAKTFSTLSHLNPGFDQDHVIEAVIDPWDAGFSQQQSAALLANVKKRTEQLPGVRAVSFARSELMRGIGMKTTVTPVGEQLPKGTFLNTSLNMVTPEYFDSLGIPLLAGRSLSSADAGVKPAHIVVNRAFADYFFPNQSPLGKAILEGVSGAKAPTDIIVGVVGTAKYRSMREIDPPTFYTAVDMAHTGGVIYIRTHGDPAPMVGALRAILHDLAPTLPVASIYTLRREIEASLWQERLVTLLCAFFGIAALLLSVIGIYSALAFSVGRRLRELGIRMAIGAQAADIVRTVTARLSVAVSLGLIAGLAASALLLKFMRALLFQPGSTDIPSFATAVAILLFCSATAAAVPAWRAIHIEPTVALRQE